MLTASPVIAPSDAYSRRFSRPAAHSSLPIRHSINGKARRGTTTRSPPEYVDRKPAAESLHIKRMLTASPVIAPSDAYSRRFSRPAARSSLFHQALHQRKSLPRNHDPFAARIRQQEARHGIPSY